MQPFNTVARKTALSRVPDLQVLTVFTSAANGRNVGYDCSILHARRWLVWAEVDDRQICKEA
jgi:hypothetical protein